VLKDLAGVDADLAFWKRRLSEGSHGRFLLLSRGPASFLRSLSAAAHRHAPQAEGGSKRLSAADKIERRVSFRKTSRRPDCVLMTLQTRKMLLRAKSSREVRRKLDFCEVSSLDPTLLRADHRASDG